MIYDRPALSGRVFGRTKKGYRNAFQLIN